MAKLLGPCAVAATVALGWAAPAHAALVTLQQGESVVLNFDFGAVGASPAQPYNWLLIYLYAQGFGAGEAGTYQFFNEWDAVGAANGSTLSSSTISFDSRLPGIGDGVFSVEIAATSGGFSFDPRAFGFTEAGQRTLPIEGQIGTRAVAEPMSVALAGLGLVGLALSRQRRRS